MSKYKIRSLNDVIITKMRKSIKFHRKGETYTPISINVKNHPQIMKAINKWSNRFYDPNMKIMTIAFAVDLEKIVYKLGNISDYMRKAIISYSEYLDNTFEESESLFWDKAEFIRSAFIFYTIIKKEKKDKEIEDQSDPNKIIIDNKELSVLRFA